MAKTKVSTSGAANKKLPLNQSIPLGIQHVFAMFAGNITVPLIVAGVVDTIIPPVALNCCQTFVGAGRLEKKDIWLELKLPLKPVPNVPILKL